MQSSIISIITTQTLIGCIPPARKQTRPLKHAREVCADFINASPAEIAFGANMTTLTFHLARTLGAQYGPGDEIVVTELDHHANVAPWQYLSIERGITVRTVKMVPETGQLDWDDFEQAVNKRTKLVAIGAASNALGTINQIERATRMARSSGRSCFWMPYITCRMRSRTCELWIVISSACLPTSFMDHTWACSTASRRCSSL